MSSPPETLCMGSSIPGGLDRLADMTVTYEWRGDFDSAAVEALHAEGFGHAPVEYDWNAQVERHSLGWVCASDGDDLVGFVNVAWDGGVHAFIPIPWSRSQL